MLKVIILTLCASLALAKQQALRSQLSQKAVVAEVWDFHVGNCLSTIMETYPNYDAAQSACAMESTCLGVREPEHQTRRCSQSHTKVEDGATMKVRNAIPTKVDRHVLNLPSPKLQVHVT